MNGRGDLAAEVVDGDQPTDPRQRPWYELAKAGRVWVDHVLAENAAVQALTCAEPLTAEGRVIGVLRVTFSRAVLSETIDPLSDDPLVDNVLLMPTGIILAMPHNWVPAGAERIPAPGMSTVSPDVAAFRNALPKLADIGPSGVRVTFLSHGEELLCSILPCTVRGGPKLFLAQVISQNLLIGKATAALSVSLIMAAFAMSGGIAAAWWFAARLARARREAVRERQRADAAEADAESLGAYRLIKQLGHGGMGEVWLGEHTFLARRAAIKRISPEVFRDLDATEQAKVSLRFNDEARITAALRSRSTVELYDYGTARDGSFYYVMELLDGITLGTLIARFGPQPIGRVVRLLIQACGSLAEAHGCGLVHRDIKPDNLYLCRRADEVDLLKVIDFGLVRVPVGTRAAEAVRGIVMGTPSTISPEQARNEDLDGRSDIYSLGCVAYSLLTGRTVFDLPNPLQMLNAHKSTPPDPPSRHRPGIPAKLDRIVMICLAKDRSERPQSARQLAAMLAALPIPAGETWTEEDSRAWWDGKMPPADNGILSPATAQGGRVVGVTSGARSKPTLLMAPS